MADNNSKDKKTPAPPSPPPTEGKLGKSTKQIVTNGKPSAPPHKK